MKLIVTTIFIFLISSNCDGQKNAVASDSVSQTPTIQQFQNGDIIFQTSLSRQSKAIQLATNSQYSHCGIICIENGIFYVLEAIQPIKYTPLTDWINRGANGQFTVKRLKNATTVLTLKNIDKLKTESTKFIGKNYDLTFEWSDEKIYCSELIWKIYDGALGIKIGHLQKLKDFNLTNPYVQKIIKERYGKDIPLNEIVISPEAIFKSELLETVIQK